MLRVLQIYYKNNTEAKEQRIAKVKEGIRFILTHFEGRQRLFPRKMSTSLSRGIVYNEEQIITECIKSNAYPVLSDDDMDAAIQGPNLIFIDIDSPSLYHTNLLPELSIQIGKEIFKVTSITHNILVTHIYNIP